MKEVFVFKLIPLFPGPLFQERTYPDVLKVVQETNEGAEVTEQGCACKSVPHLEHFVLFCRGE